MNTLEYKIAVLIGIEMAAGRWGKVKELQDKLMETQCV